MTDGGNGIDAGRVQDWNERRCDGRTEQNAADAANTAGTASRHTIEENWRPVWMLQWSRLGRWHNRERDGSVSLYMQDDVFRF